MVRLEDEARDVVPALDKEQRRGAAVAEIEGGHFPAWKWRKSSFGDTELEPRPRQTCRRCLMMSKDKRMHILAQISVQNPSTSDIRMFGRASCKEQG